MEIWLTVSVTIVPIAKVIVVVVTMNTVEVIPLTAVMLVWPTSSEVV
jgi:hypothetical protein